MPERGLVPLCPFWQRAAHLARELKADEPSALAVLAIGQRCVVQLASGHQQVVMVEGACIYYKRL